MQTEKQSDEAGYEDSRANKVELANQEREISRLGGCRSRRESDEEDNRENGDGAEGKIDPETPAPGRSIGEDTCEQTRLAEFIP